MAFYVGCLGGSDLLGFFNVFVPDVFPLLLQETVEVQRRRRSEKSGRTHPLVPAVPELRDADVKAHTKGECASEDRRNVHACEERETSSLVICSFLDAG